MRLTFYIDRPDAPVSAIMINVAVGGKRFRFSTGISVVPTNWNHERQEIRAADPDRSAHGVVLKKWTLRERCNFPKTLGKSNETRTTFL